MIILPGSTKLSIGIILCIVETADIKLADCFIVLAFKSCRLLSHSHLLVLRNFNTFYCKEKLLENYKESNDYNFCFD